MQFAQSVYLLIYIYVCVCVCVCVCDFQNKQGNLNINQLVFATETRRVRECIFKYDRSIHPRFRHLIPGLSPRRIPGLIGSAYVKFLVEKVALGFVFSRQFQYSLLITLYYYFTLVFNNITFNRRCERSLGTFKEGITV
jgi:hypothetical protein